MSSLIRYGTPQGPGWVPASSRPVGPVAILVEEVPPTKARTILAQELPIPLPYVHVGWQPVDPAAAPPEGTPARAVIPQSVPVAQPAPFIFVSTPHIEPPAAPVVTPLKPVVATAIQPPPQLGTVWVNHAELQADAPQGSLVVTAEQPWAKPFTLVGAPKAEPPAAAPQVPIRSTIVTSESPITAPFVGHIGFSVDSGIAPSQVPSRPTVVAAQQFLSQPFISVAPRKTEPPPPAPEVPVRSTVVTSEPPITAPMVGHVGFNVDSGIAPAGPTVPPRPLIIASAGPPPPPVDQILLWAQVMAETPTRPQVTPAQTPLVAPFVFVNKPKAFDVAPPPPQIPIRPTVVAAQPVPPQTQAPFRFHSRVDPPPPPPSVPIRPTIVSAQPLPPQVQPPTVTRTYYEEPKTPTKSLFVAGQQLPTQPAFIFTPKGGRWGNPPPNHRIITPTVVFDVSRPPFAPGWAKVAHGFEEALPVVSLGDMTGGIRQAVDLTGGRHAESAEIAGSQRVLVGNLTGGTRQ